MMVFVVSLLIFMMFLFEFDNVIKLFLSVICLFLLCNINQDWMVLFMDIGLMFVFLLLDFFGKDTLDLKFLMFLNFVSLLLMISNTNLFYILLCLEVQTFSSLMYICKNKKNPKSMESGLKYFILGSISSSVFILGLCFLVESGWSMNLMTLNYLNYEGVYQYNIGYTLLILSILFKMGVFPFHFWVPDVFEGSNYKVIYLISTIPKLSLIYLLCTLIFYGKIVLFLSLLSIIIGSFAAMNQTKIKSLIAYSSMVHFGFMFITVFFMNEMGYEMLISYVISYFMNVSLLIIIIINTLMINFKYMMELRGFYNLNNPIGVVFMMIVFSFSGLPPFLGFYPKWMVIMSLMELKYTMTSMIIIMITMISVGFYLSLAHLLIFYERNNFLLWEKILLNKQNYNYKYNLIVGVISYWLTFLLINPFVFNLFILWGMVNTN